MRLIDADVLIEEMPTVMDMQDTYLPIHFKEWLIDEAPTIEPKRGEWIEPTVDESITIAGRCSVCGWESHLYEDDVVGMPFCPNCGADMREREGE